MRKHPEDQQGRYRWGGFIDDVDKFDPLFFGISPAEAEMMDPQQRVLLETVWAAIEDSGYRPSQLAGRDVGLFAGVQFSDYQHLLHEAGVLNAQVGLGNEHSIVVNRISYLLDLRGPSEPVNTACSSSLVAVHRAVQSIRNGESSMAIAGGIALNLAPFSTVAAAMMGLLSPQGRCRTLDRGADGYVKGEGVGVVVLKTLSQAVADGDTIYAVIRGTSVNHGGRAASITAPSTAAQAALLREAVEEAGVGPESIGYLELHGTGTELGDPVEINGIKSAFRQLAGSRGSRLPAEPYCGVGSVKTNIGHLEPASGIAGLIKVILSMRHATLPGLVHLDEMNPYVDLRDSPFYPVREAVPWQRLTSPDGRTLPRRAGVSSFGFGGVNAHVFLEEYPAGAPAPAAPSRDRVYLFSAKTPAALDSALDRFLEWLDRWGAVRRRHRMWTTSSSPCARAGKSSPSGWRSWRPACPSWTAGCGPSGAPRTIPMSTVDTPGRLEPEPHSQVRRTSSRPRGWPVSRCSGPARSRSGRPAGCRCPATPSTAPGTGSPRRSAGSRRATSAARRHSPASHTSAPCCATSCWTGSS
ncbi:hypothetical protein Pflav_013330 [Phytohabitans flavus]|uniref:Ketosynthase family 3 (KS3) domain-containing protein n=1 Tax=Phytohabitans flavus TaxID=1076124 RepID=A0A6F8XM90_9ACTN|nr:polyketide synthase [Phytohabitans flavus]BCB74923.1 hypothetical protein Pflav_013330 [Phytohabitans flavus]